MGSMMLFVVCIAAICMVLNYIPSMSAIKLLLMFLIGFTAVYAFFGMWDELDGRK